MEAFIDQMGDALLDNVPVGTQVVVHHGHEIDQPCTEYCRHIERKS